jgi:benzoyl-CoA reductase/2-hydroxyglutaryl-CoA dehydratase subunit BcrC/BadD/HgdB
MLAGSIVAEQDLGLIRMIEERAAIVTDLLCNGVRSFYGFPRLISDRSDPSDKSDAPGAVNQVLARLADFYFDQPGCISRRPNTGYYDLARRLQEQFRVEAVILKTLLFCDAYNFEARQMARELDLPLLHIDTDYGDGNREQLRTRVEAFLEML